MTTPAALYDAQHGETMPIGRVQKPRRPIPQNGTPTRRLSSDMMDADRNGHTESTMAQRDWLWRDLGDLADEPEATHLVNGLLVNGNITLLYAPIKVGKSRLLMGLLASLAAGGPQFLGMELKTTRTLLFSEEPPTVLGERVRDFKVPTGMHIVNTASALAMPPDAFAAQMRTAHEQESKQHGSFGLIAVDTLGAFVNCKDWNDYTATTAAMAPLRDLARSLPNVAILLLHHQSKAGGADWAGALGSTALAGNADQLVRMSKKNSQHQITVGGRNKPDPFPFDEPTTISISSSGVEFIGTATHMAADVLFEQLGDAPSTIKEIREALGEDAPTLDVSRNALRALVSDGKAQVTKGAGRKGDSYQRAS